MDGIGRLALECVDDRWAISLVFDQQLIEFPHRLQAAQHVESVGKAHAAVHLIDPEHALLGLKPEADTHHVGPCRILKGGVH